MHFISNYFEHLQPKDLWAVLRKSGALRVLCICFKQLLIGQGSRRNGQHTQWPTPDSSLTTGTLRAGLPAAQLSDDFRPGQGPGANEEMMRAPEHLGEKRMERKAD